MNKSKPINTSAFLTWLQEYANWCRKGKVICDARSVVEALYLRGLNPRDAAVEVGAQLKEECGEYDYPE